MRSIDIIWINEASIFNIFLNCLKVKRRSNFVSHNDNICLIYINKIHYDFRFNILQYSVDISNMCTGCFYEFSLGLLPPLIILWILLEHKTFSYPSSHSVCYFSWKTWKFHWPCFCRDQREQFYKACWFIGQFITFGSDSGFLDFQSKFEYYLLPKSLVLNHITYTLEIHDIVSLVLVNTLILDIFCYVS